MASIRQMGTVAAMLVAGAWLLGASPATADEEDDAVEACKAIAENRDWDDSDTEISKEGENRIVVQITGEKGGDERKRRCVYNTQTEEARFDF